LNLKIHIPKNNTAERKYILSIIFNEFLKLDFEIIEEKRDNYLINLGSGSSIIFEDAFFNNYPEDLSYLNIRNIPDDIIFSKNQFTTEENIPVIYGTNKIDVFESKIICGIDIFASSFFMLTRWEEHVIIEKDIHGRTPDIEQLVFKKGIHYRPIVNEYIEMLRSMFLFLGFEVKNAHKFSLLPTHDIDFFARYNTLTNKFRAVFGDIFKRKSFKKAFSTISDIRNIRKGKLKDPYDTFDYLMDISEKRKVKSIFYFIPAILGETDASYNIQDKAVMKKIKHILKRGHIVGLHGAYRSYKDLILYKEEFNRFQNELDLKHVRQHYLRFSNPLTWDIHESLGFETDSTMGFMTDAGFRAGTCYSYSLFNVLTRKKLKLKEDPLIVMEQALRKKYPLKDEFQTKFVEIKETVEKYSGTFVLLWHNNNFHVDEWEGFKELYEHLI